MNELKKIEKQLEKEIERTKKRLVKQWKETGAIEDLGNEEYKEIEERYNEYIYKSKEIRRLLERFFDWTGNYDGH
jgi:predicted  nucleic acid-binding Zn-ribbon protein